MVEPSSEEEDYKAAAHSTADYASYQAPQKAPNPMWRKVGIGLAVLAVIVILALAGYWYAKNHKSTPKPTSSASSSQNSTTNTPAAAKITTATKHYDSVNFNLGFDYPADWTVTDSGGGIMTVRSPAINLKDASGQAVNTQITITIRAKNQKLPEFDAGNATAALDSEKIAYTKPTQSQRANTYISFLSYAKSSGGFDGIYITGNNGYKKDQAIPKVDIQTVDPVISITFDKSISTDNWSDQAFAQPLKNMLQSLSIT